MTYSPTHGQSPTLFFSAVIGHLFVAQATRPVVFRVCFVYKRLVNLKGPAGSLMTGLSVHVYIIMSVLCSSMN